MADDDSGVGNDHPDRGHSTGDETVTADGVRAEVQSLSNLHERTRPWGRILLLIGRFGPSGSRRRDSWQVATRISELAGDQLLHLAPHGASDHVYVLLLNSRDLADSLERLDASNDTRDRWLSTLSACRVATYERNYTGHSVGLLWPTEGDALNESAVGNFLWKLGRPPPHIDAMALAGDRNELQIDLALAVLSALAESNPNFVIQLARNAVETKQIRNMHPRLRERLADIFDEYAKLLRGHDTPEINDSSDDPVAS